MPLTTRSPTYEWPGGSLYQIEILTEDKWGIGRPSYKRESKRMKRTIKEICNFEKFAIIIRLINYNWKGK